MIFFTVHEGCRISTSAAITKVTSSGTGGGRSPSTSTAIAGGGGVNLYNSMGNAWTADYLKVMGELDVDLRSHIAAEARAKIVYGG